MRIAVIITVLACLLGPGLVHAQAEDTAAERARLGNDRARIEAERRAREAAANMAAPTADAVDEPPPAAAVEKPRAEASGIEASPPAPVPESAPPTDESAAPLPGRGANQDAAPRSTDPAEISRALEQLRELGELRDAGYLTDEEFERVKQRILDSRF